MAIVLVMIASISVLLALKALMCQAFWHKCHGCGGRFTAVETLDTSDFSGRAVTHDWQVIVCLKPWCRKRKVLVGIEVRQGPNRA